MSATARSNRLPGFRALLAAGALAASAGCADNETSVYIRLMKAPTAQMGQCSVTNDMSGAAVTEGVLDLAFRRTYNLAPLIQNNIFGRFDNQSNRAESNHVFIEGYIVEIRRDSPNGDLYRYVGSDPMPERFSFSNPFSVYQSLTIPASLQGTASFGATIFEALPQVVGDTLFQEVCTESMGIAQIPGVPAGVCVPRYNPNVLRRIILSVSAFGHTGGSVSVQTPKYNFPVTVCCGCLRQFPVSLMASAVDAGPGAVVNPSCARETIAQSPAACPNFFGQDYLVPCGLCADSLPNVCEPTGHSFNATTICPR
jgi:hypothetical protein